MSKRIKIFLAVFLLIIIVSVTLFFNSPSQRQKRTVTKLSKSYGLAGGNVKLNQEEKLGNWRDGFFSKEREKRLALNYDIGEIDYIIASIELLDDASTKDKLIYGGREANCVLFKSPEHRGTYGWIEIDLGNYNLRMPLKSSLEDIITETARFESVDSPEAYLDYLGYNPDKANIIKNTPDEMNFYYMNGSLSLDLDAYSRNAGYKPYEHSERNVMYTAKLSEKPLGLDTEIIIFMRENLPIASFMRIDKRELSWFLCSDASDIDIRNKLADSGISSVLLDEWIDSAEDRCGPIIPKDSQAENDNQNYDDEAKISDMLKEDPMYFENMSADQLEYYNGYRETNDLYEYEEDDDDDY